MHVYCGVVLNICFLLINTDRHYNTNRSQKNTWTLSRYWLRLLDIEFLYTSSCTSFLGRLTISLNSKKSTFLILSAKANEFMPNQAIIVFEAVAGTSSGWLWIQFFHSNKTLFFLYVLSKNSSQNRVNVFSRSTLSEFQMTESTVKLFKCYISDHLTKPSEV